MRSCSVGFIGLIFVVHVGAEPFLEGGVHLSSGVVAQDDVDKGRGNGHGSLGIALAMPNLGIVFSAMGGKSTWPIGLYVDIGTSIPFPPTYPSTKNHYDFHPSTFSDPEIKRRKVHTRGSLGVSRRINRKVLGFVAVGTELQEEVVTLQDPFFILGDNRGSYTVYDTYEEKQAWGFVLGGVFSYDRGKGLYLSYRINSHGSISTGWSVGW